MSDTVDRRIVELKFDNQQFAQAIKSTLTQLDELKKSLSLTNVTEGVDQVENRFNRFNLRGAISAVGEFFKKIASRVPFVDIDTLENRFNDFKTSPAMQAVQNFIDKFRFKTAHDGVAELEADVNNMDLSPAEQAIISLEQRFSTLGIIGATAISKITSTALSMAGGLVGKVVDPIVSGGYQRAQSIENATFLLQGLLNDADLVSRIRDTASASVTDTAYGLDEAFSAAAMFAASGIRDTDKLGRVLSGVAGTAATLSADYSEISHIFTTVAGNGKLMTEQLNQFAYRGMNAAATMTDAFNSVLQGTSELAPEVQDQIRAMVQWAKDTDLKNFTGSMSGIIEGDLRALVTAGRVNFDIFSEIMAQTFGPHAKKAQETFTGSLANVKAQLKQVGQLFYEDLIVQNGPITKMFGSLREALKQFKVAATDAIKAPARWINTAATYLTQFLDKLVSFGAMTSVGQSLSTFTKATEAIAAAFERVFHIRNLDTFFGSLARDLQRLAAYFILPQSAIDDLAGAFEGLFHIVHIGWTFFSAGVDIFVAFANAAKQIFIAVLDVASSIGRFFGIADKAITDMDALGTGVEFITKVIAFAADVISKGLHTVADAIDAIYGFFFEGGILTLGNNIKSFFIGVRDAIAGLFGGMGFLAGFNTLGLDETLFGDMSFMDRAKYLFDIVGQHLQGAWSKIVENAKNFGLNLKNNLKIARDNLLAWGSSVGDWAVNVKNTVAAKVTEGLNAIKAAYEWFIHNTGPVGEAVESGVNYISEQFGYLGEWLAPYAAEIRAGFEGFVESVKSFAAELSNPVQAFNKAVAYVQNGFDSLMTSIEVSGGFVPWVQSIIDLGVRRITSALTELKNWLATKMPISFKAFYSSAKRYLGGALNYIGGTLGDVFTGVSAFVSETFSSIDWDAIGKFFGDLWEDVQEKWGDFLEFISPFTDQFKEAFDTIGSVVGEFAANVNIPLAIFEALIGAGQIFLSVVHGIADVVKTIWDLLQSIVGGLIDGVIAKLGELGSSLNEALGQVTPEQIQAIAGLIVLVFLLRAVRDTIMALDTLAGTPKKIADGIKKIGDELKKFREALTLGIETKADAFIKYALALTAMIAALSWVGSTLTDAEGNLSASRVVALGIAVLALTVLAAAMAGLIYVMSKIKWSDKNSKQFSSMAFGILEIGVAMAAILDGISKILSAPNMTNDSLKQATTTVVLIVGVMAAMAAVIMRSSGPVNTISNNGGTLIKAGVAMVLVGKAVEMIADTLIRLAALHRMSKNSDSIVAALWDVIVIMGMLAAVTAVAGYSEFSAGAGVGILLAAVAVRLLADLVTTLGSIPKKQAKQGMEDLVIIMAMLAILSYAMGLMVSMAGGAVGAIASAGAILLAVLALNLIVSVLYSLVGLDVNAISGQLFTMAGVFLTLVIVLAVMSMVGETAYSAAAAGLGLMLAAAALYILGAMLNSLTAIDFVSILPTLGAIALCVAGIGIALKLMSSFAADAALAAVGMVLGAIAVAALAGVLYLIQALDPVSALVDALALAALVLAIGAAFALMGAIGAPVLIGAAAIALGAVALALLGASLIVASIGIAALAAAIELIDPEKWTAAGPALSAMAYGLAELGAAGIFLAIGAVAVAVGLVIITTALVAFIAVAMIGTIVLTLFAIAVGAFAEIAAQVGDGLLHFAQTLAALGEYIGPLIAFGVVAVVVGALLAIFGEKLLIGAIALLVISTAFLIFEAALNGLSPEHVTELAGSFVALAGSLVALLGGMLAFTVGAALFVVSAALVSVGLIILTAGIGVCIAALSALGIVLLTVTGIFSVFISMGANLVIGFVQGVAGAISGAISAITGFFGGIVGAVAGVLGIHSPSTEFAFLGDNSALGYIQGFMSESGNAQGAAFDFTNIFTGTLADGAKDANTAGKATSKEYAAGAASGVPDSADAGSMNVDALLTQLQSGNDDANGAGFDIMSAFGDGASGFDMSSLGIDGMDMFDGLDFNGAGLAGMDFGGTFGSSAASVDQTQNGEKIVDNLGTAVDNATPKVEQRGNSLGEALGLSTVRSADATIQANAPTVADSGADTVNKSFNDALNEGGGGLDLAPWSERVGSSFNAEAANVDTSSAANTLNANTADSLQKSTPVYFGGLGAQAGNTYINAIGEANSAKAAEAIYNNFRTYLPDYAGTGKMHASWYVNGFQQGAAQANTVAAQIVNGASNALNNSGKGFTTAGQQAGRNFVTGIATQTTPASTAGSNLARAAYKGAQEAVPSLRSAGVAGGNVFVQGIASRSSSAYSAGASIAKAAASGLASTSSAKAAGVYFVQGYISGINSAWSTAIVRARQLGEATVASLKAGIKSASPSKETMKVGRYFVQGYAIGIEKYANEAIGQAEYLGEDTVGALRDSFNIIDALDLDDPSYNPVITPVLDLSLVEAGAANLSGIFGQTPTIEAGLAHEAVLSQVAQSSANPLAGLDLTQMAPNYSFEQNNYSPNPLSRMEIYRQTRSMFARSTAWEVNNADRGYSLSNTRS